MFEQKVVEEADLTEKTLHQMLLMKSLVWPDRYNASNCHRHFKEFPGKRGFCSGRKFVLIYEADRLVAQSEQFPRTVRSADTSLEILALAGVCTHPDYRGRGLGRQVVEPVFHQIDAGNFSFCLFQTSVPDFYAHLGAGVVEDTFYNGRDTPKSAISIWWENCVMVYPENRTWLKGSIDLNGPAY